MRNPKVPRARGRPHPLTCPALGYNYAAPQRPSPALRCPLVPGGRKTALGLKVTALCPGLTGQLCGVRVLGAQLVLSQTPCQGSDTHLSTDISDPSST